MSIIAFIFKFTKLISLIYVNEILLLTTNFIYNISVTDVTITSE